MRETKEAMYVQKDERCRWGEEVQNAAEHATQTEAEGNGNGNLHAVEDEREREREGGREQEGEGRCVSATSPRRSRTESCIDTQATPLPERVSGTENGRINFVVGDAFAVAECYILP